MAIVDALLPEFDHEMATTRRLLDRVPDAELAWKPHDKSMSLAELSGHIADIPYWCSKTIEVSTLDLDTFGPPPAPPESRASLLATFDRNVSAARSLLMKTTDPEMKAAWTLKKGDEEFFTLPRISALRYFVMNHTIHHRGQLSVYLRLRNVAVPPIYGPTADETQ